MGMIEDALLMYLVSLNREKRARKKRGRLPL